ncbi:MAG: heavy metal translocating P-type ATPase [Peptococcia bacterium]|jgi:Cd2+/Zn2+-exporting ATPase
MTEKKRQKLWFLGIGIIIYFIAILFSFSPQLELALFLVSYVLIGGEIVYYALRNICRGQIFDENFLMTIATLGAFAIKVYPEAVAVMLFYRVGEAVQDLAVNRSRRSIQALLEIRPDYANLQKENEIVRVSPTEVAVGDLIVVKPGERVPLDGKIVEGNSLVDTSALTGETVPRRLQEGEEILSGFINTSGLLLVEVTKEYSQSTVAKILDLVQNASSKKAPTENFITKFARYYTPAVVAIAALLALVPPLIIPGAVFADWLYRALVFLVISCPCALVISIPLGFFGGIGGASRNGILVKGGNNLEALNYVEAVVFDKTGTMTQGVFKVTALYPVDGFKEEELLQYAVWAEAFSTHPIAKSILEFYGGDVLWDKIVSYEEIAGRGMKVSVAGKTILAGNRTLMVEEGVSVDEQERAGTVIHVAVDGQYVGAVVISDKIKEDSRQTLEGLKNLGVQKLVMLTGDSKAVATQVARELGIEEFYAELLPQEKVEQIEKIYENKGKGNLVFVGDGINDAPVLARADVGVAMGALGSDAAIEAADVVIMNDQPSKLVTAMQIARRTKKIVWQNIFLALMVKAIVLILGAGGIATMWEAVFADVGVALLAIFNATRVMS